MAYFAKLCISEEDFDLYDLQKANRWKRIWAYLFDLIVLVMVIVGVAFLLSAALGYDKLAGRLEDSYNKYGEL